MTATRTHIWLVAALALLVACLTPNVVQGQESGTVLTQTLTFLKGALNPAIDFEVAGGANGKEAGSQTKLYLEFGAEGSAAPPADPMLPAGVQFKLTKVGGANPQATFTPAGGSSPAFTPKLVVLSKGLEKPNDPRGLFLLLIVHEVPAGSPAGTKGVPANAVETWKLELLNVPPGLRAVATIDQGTFTHLTPAAVCSSGSQPCPIAGETCKPPCPSVCGPGESCQPYKFRFEDYFFVEKLKWPPIPPECLSCPLPWKTLIPDGFDRTVVSVFPIIQGGELLGPGRAREISLNIRGGEAVGDLFDAGGGQYFQAVQFRKGASPTVSATAAGVTSMEAVVAPPTGGSNTLALVLGVLLVLSLVVIGYLLTQRGRVNAARG